MIIGHTPLTGKPENTCGDGRVITVDMGMSYQMGVSFSWQYGFGGVVIEVGDNTDRVIARSIGFPDRDMDEFYALQPKVLDAVFEATKRDRQNNEMIVRNTLAADQIPTYLLLFYADYDHILKTQDVLPFYEPKYPWNQHATPLDENGYVKGVTETYWTREYFDKFMPALEHQVTLKHASTSSLSQNTDGAIDTLTIAMIPTKKTPMAVDNGSQLEPQTPTIKHTQQIITNNKLHDGSRSSGEHK